LPAERTLRAAGLTWNEARDERLITCKRSNLAGEQSSGEEFSSLDIRPSFRKSFPLVACFRFGKLAAFGGVLNPQRLALSPIRLPSSRQPFVMRPRVSTGLRNTARGRKRLSSGAR